MRGKVVNFSIKEGQGLISGDDLKRYRFKISEWQDELNPVVGMAVDFDIDEGGAVEIYSIRNNSNGNVESEALESEDTISQQESGKSKASAGVNNQHFRSSSNKVFAGVCAGLALRWGWNITALRWLSAICCLFFWPLFIVYLIAWSILPSIDTYNLEIETISKAEKKIPSLTASPSQSFEAVSGGTKYQGSKVGLLLFVIIFIAIVISEAIG